MGIPFLCRLTLCSRWSINPQIFFRSSCSLCRYIFNVPVEGDELRVLLYIPSFPSLRQGISVIVYFPWKKRCPMILTNLTYYQFSSVQLLSCVQLFATPWIAACKASLSITNSQSSLRFMSIESVMPSSHLILCRLLLLLPPIPPSIRVFSNESTLHMRLPKYLLTINTYYSCY